MVFDPAQLRMASFDGLPFWVMSGGPEAGHRVSTTEIPNGTHVNERFGPSARKFEIEAYCVGAGAYAQAAALLARAESAPVGLLVLPDSGGRRVNLTKAKSSFDREKLGYVTVALEAVAEPAAATGGYGASTLEQMVYAAAGLLATALGPGAALAFNRVPAALVSAAIEAGAAPMARLDRMTLDCRLDPVAMEAIAPSRLACRAALPLLVSDPATYGTALGAWAVALGDAAAPDLLAAALDALGPPALALSQPLAGASAMLEAGYRESGVGLSAAVSALALGESMARRQFIERPQAVRARTLAAGVFDDALSRCGRLGYEMAQALSAMAGVISELVTRRAADLAPLMSISAGARLPALWWAWRLHGAPGRAAEIAGRSGTLHPSLMPLQFEALAG